MAIRPRLAKAKVILSLGADFLNGEDPEALAAWGAKRRLKDAREAINRLWVLEGPLTLTGTNADQRLPVSPSRLGAVAFALAKELAAKGLPLPAGTDLSACSAGVPAGVGIPPKAWYEPGGGPAPGAAGSRWSSAATDARRGPPGRAPAERHAAASETVALGPPSPWPRCGTWRTRPGHGRGPLCRRDPAGA